ncbi:ganglioside GM2 activator-like [Haliotis cracherodii]|uniref:ganglioside GM2 activator-like n=1 Tax=Haliotis cracherodii TaxID=6455 RepID=UPI0039E81983
MLWLLLVFNVPALGVRPGFHSTGNLEWRDCGVGDSWVSVKQFDVSPSPVTLPGEFTVSFVGTITHSIRDDVTMDVLMEKELLGSFVKEYCIQDFGTCHYTDPCHFFNIYRQQGICPPQLTANGIPCTCPFNPDQLHMPPTKFSIFNISAIWKYLLSYGNYYLKITLNEKRTHQLRGCFETYLVLDSSA